MPDIYEYIGEMIRKLRGSMSQEELANALGTTANTVSRWETGTYKPTPENLDQIARYFKVSITVFFPDMKPDSRLSALASATGGLSDTDFAEVVRYAEFRKARNRMETAKKATKKKR